MCIQDGDSSVVVDLEGDICDSHVAIWCGFFVEDIDTWFQVNNLRLASFGCPFLNWSSFCLVTCIDFNLCTCDFFTAKVYLGEGDLAWQIVSLIGDGNLRTVGDNFVVLTFGILFTDVGNRHSTVIVNLEGDVSYLEEAIWCSFFMEDIGTWCQVQHFRSSAWGPFLYWSACNGVSCVDFNFCTIHFVTTQVDLGEGDLAWQIVSLIGDGNLRTVGDNDVVLALGILLTDVGHGHIALVVNLKGDIGYLEEAIWCSFFMEDIGTWCQVQLFRSSAWGPFLYWSACDSVTCVDFNLCTFHFVTTQVDLGEGDLLRCFVILVSDDQLATLVDSWIALCIQDGDSSVVVDLEGDVSNGQIAIRSCFFMEDIRANWKAELVRLVLNRGPFSHWRASCSGSFVDFNLRTCNFYTI